MTYKGRIEYTIKETHPDKDCVIGGWKLNKIYDYEDEYHINPDMFYGEDHIKKFISEDLKLVAGGGYNWKHIDNIKITIEEVV